MDATVGKPPLISIISVVYNGAEGLPSTIESVLRQERDDLEYIVIDGGSTDCTVELLRSYGDRIDYWMSASDAGIYDAMNKGIALARGQFVYHLNVGDELQRIPKLFDEPVLADTMCIAGVVQTAQGGLHVPSVGTALKFHNTLHHQGCFYRKTRELHYDVSYKVFSDFDLNQRILSGRNRVALSPEIVATHDVGGISHTTNRFFEVYDIVRKNFGPRWVLVCFFYFKVRGLMKRAGVS
jgi:cellulose synthase/poly-beta-1,6-N-acetylglucosamine synthase-like glycosyltransferase